MTAGAWVVLAALLVAGVAFVGIGRWGASNPDHLVSTLLPPEEQASQAERFQRAGRRAQVLGAVLVVLATASAVIAVA